MPQPRPDRQAEKLREGLADRLRSLAEDPDVELWYGDETGVEGEPKPRRSWAIEGSRPRTAHNGDHIRLNILGTVCPRTGDFFASRGKPLRQRRVSAPYSPGFNPIERIWPINYEAGSTLRTFTARAWPP